jgi:hypothetical protein
MRIDFEAVESLAESKDERLSLTYFSTESSGFKKVTEAYDCFEIPDLIKCYHSIRNIVQSAAFEEPQKQKAQSFMGTQMFQKLKPAQEGASPPVKKKTKQHTLV